MPFLARGAEAGLTGRLSTRDGTKLAYSVHPPTDVLNIAGLDLPPELVNVLQRINPAPTLIEYPGYGYAKPDGPQSGIAPLANLMGFTVVDVSMRGTGCSGGSFDFFEPLQNLDGYDVIETIARQPWVKGDKVGMLGISYRGISRLYRLRLQLGTGAHARGAARRPSVPRLRRLAADPRAGRLPITLCPTASSRSGPGAGH